MRLIEIFSRLKELKTPVLGTNDLVAYLKVNKSHASTILSRLEEAGHMVRVKRGLWVFPDKSDQLSMAEFLTAPFPSYISLQSAMYFHGMISQIPEIIYSISLARTRVYRTPMGTYSIHHIHSSFFFGFESTKSGIKMATPEKALLDFLYLNPARSRLFHSLPELELSPKFNIKTARQMICRSDSYRRMTLLRKLFEDFLSGYRTRTG